MLLPLPSIPQPHQKYRFLASAPKRQSETRRSRPDRAEWEDRLPKPLLPLLAAACLAVSAVAAQALDVRAAVLRVDYPTLLPISRYDLRPDDLAFAGAQLADEPLARVEVEELHLLRAHVREQVIVRHIIGTLDVLAL